MAKSGNMFRKAANEAKKEAKKTKPKGTVIELPQEVGDDNQLRPEFRRLHDAVHLLIESDSDAKAAKNKANLAKGQLNGWANPEIARRIATGNGLPPTPIKLVNSKGEEVTYVITDKAGQYALKDDQVEELEELLGEDAAAKLYDRREVYSFDPQVMNEQVSDDESVADVIFEIVSKAIERNTKLSDAQKESLIRCDDAAYLKKGACQLAPAVCGQDAAKIAEFLDVVSAQITRYVKP